MKKTLSLLLVLAMVLSSFSFAFAAEAEKTPGETLKDLGVLTGNAEGDLMLEDELSRQDMVVLLSRVLGQEDEAKAFKGEMSFTDVNDSFYKPYIAWAEANKLTNGVEEAKFGFGRPVTEQEVAQFMLRALNYTDVEFKDVPAKAVELGLVSKDADLTVNCKRARMAEITLAALGTKMNGSEKTLAESLGLELPKPAKLEVKEVVADNLKEIKVVFNKAVDAESATNMDNYEAPKTIENITYVEEDNMVILSLKDSLANKKEYSLKINGVKDEKATLNVEEKFTVYDNAIPVVEDVVALGTKAVKVIMSEPVEKPSMPDFKLDGKTIYGTVDGSGREVILNLYKTLEVKEYELTVRGIKDFAGYKSLESKHAFTVVEDTVKPTIENVTATLETVTVVFSEDVDPSTVTLKSVYWKNGGTKVYPIEKAKIAGNKYVFVFGGGKALPVYESTIYIEGVADYSGNKMDPAEAKVKPSIDETRPEVIKVELDEDDLKTITVKFSKAVNEKEAKTIENYRVLDSKDNKQLISKIEEVDSRTYKVVLGKALTESKEYTIKISGISDNNKYPNVMLAYEGSIAVGSYTQPKVDIVSGKYDTTTYSDKNVNIIHLYFTKEMDLSTIVDPANYLVKIGNANKLLSDVDGVVDIIKSNGTVVEIRVEGKDVEKVTGIAILGVKDTEGKLPSDYGVMYPVNEVAPTIKKAVATALDTIEVTFDQPIKTAVATDFTFTGGTATITTTDVSGLGSKVLTLSVEGLTADAGTYTLNVPANKVVALNGQKLGLATKGITDEIAPSILKEGGVGINDTTDVVITLTFDENLKVLGDLVNAAKKDLTVVRVNGSKVLEDNEYTLAVSGSTITITIVDGDAEVDSAYEVTIRGNAEFITDGDDNASEDAKVVRTGETTKVAGRLVAEEAAKITSELTFEVADADKADATKVTAAAVAAAQAKVSEGYTVTAKAEGTISETNQLTVTFVVTKNDTTIKAETGELTLTFTAK